jgi:hypothetical protein
LIDCTQHSFHSYYPDLPEQNQRYNYPFHNLQLPPQVHKAPKQLNFKITISFALLAFLLALHIILRSLKQNNGCFATPYVYGTT